MVFSFRNVVCRHSVATTQFTFTSYCIAHFCVSFLVFETRCSHTSENSKYYFIVNSKINKNSKKKQTNRSYFYGYSTHTHTSYELRYTRYYLPPFLYHFILFTNIIFSCLCSSSILFFFYFSFPFSFGKIQPNGDVGRHAVK